MLKHNLKAVNIDLAENTYAIGRDLKFDPVKEKFIGDKQADAMLTRKHRAPYVVRNRSKTMRSSSHWLSSIAVVLFSACAAQAADNVFQAGAARVDATPQHLPAIVNGSMLERLVEEVNDPLHVRAVVMDDVETKIAMVLVDSCMMPRDLLDKAKAQAAAKTGIAAENILISATHCHSAPSVIAILGTGVDARYEAFLPGQIAKAIEQANANRQPARIGFAMGKDDKCRHSPVAHERELHQQTGLVGRRMIELVCTQVTTIRMRFVKLVWKIRISLSSPCKRLPVNKLPSCRPIRCIMQELRIFQQTTLGCLQELSRNNFRREMMVVRQLP